MAQSRARCSAVVMFMLLFVLVSVQSAPAAASAENWSTSSTEAGSNCSVTAQHVAAWPPGPRPCIHCH